MVCFTYNTTGAAGKQSSWAMLPAMHRASRGTYAGAQRFDLGFPRLFRADLSIKKSSSLFPPFTAATSHLGLAPRPAQVSPKGLRYFGGTFLPFKALPP